MKLNWQRVPLNNTIYYLLYEVREDGTHMRLCTLHDVWDSWQIALINSGVSGFIHLKNIKYVPEIHPDHDKYKEQAMREVMEVFL